MEYGVPFHFHQTGARLRRSVPDGHGGHILKIYEIPREYQHTQAEKAGLDYGGGIEIPACLSADSLSICKEPEEERRKSAFARENMIIQQIRNATLKIEYGSITFLIDPW
ncbi:MAG: hypothetical protein VZQ80_11525, partial [Lachnospiraceae bacterium]|nr:hypothetical protein [Lachnospiraceae bacterium]